MRPFVLPGDGKAAERGGERLRGNVRVEIGARPLRVTRNVPTTTGI